MTISDRIHGLTRQIDSLIAQRTELDGRLDATDNDRTALDDQISELCFTQIVLMDEHENS